jgi:YfiH family protein
MELLFEARIFKDLPVVMGTVSDERALTHLNHPLATMVQTHSANCIEIDRPGRYENADGLITRKRALPLVVRHADCQPLILYESKKGWIANIHAGWRGLKANIYSQALHRIIEQKKGNPKDIFAAIGPSLGQAKAEYLDGETLFPPHFQQYQKKAHYDLKAIAKEELLSWGIPEKQIEISPICTAEDPRFHSWRRDKTDKRNATFCYLL